MRTITITINKRTKKSTVEASGFGGSCREATAAIEAALGATTNDTPTAELYEDDLSAKVERTR